MLQTLAALLVFQAIGEVLSYALRLPIPGPVLVILTGMTDAILARPLLNLLRIESHATRGFALGTAAHGIGTARAFQVSETMGAFAGLAMGLTALATALLAPWLAPAMVQLLTR